VCVCVCVCVGGGGGGGGLARGLGGELARTSTNPMGPKVNDHVSFMWP